VYIAILARVISVYAAAVRLDADHAQVRVKGGERIVRDLRRRRRDRADEGALAGVREAQQADVGQQLQFELEQALLALLARRRLPRRAVGRALEVHVAQAALAAARDQQALAVAGEVADHLVGVDVDHHRAYRDGDDLVLAALAVHLAAHAVLAALGLELALVAEVDQGVEVLVGQQPDVAALAAVAAVRPAQRDELLAPEAHAAVAAVAGSDGDFSFVDQLHGAGTRGMGNEGSGQCKGACGREASTTPLIPFTPLIPRLRNKKPRRSGAPRNRWGYPQAAGTTLTVRRFFAPLIANSTV